MQVISFVNECFNTTVTPQILKNDTNMLLLDETEQLRFDWDEYQQGLLLGGFYWFTGFFFPIGGVLIQKYGAKKINGLSIFLSCLIPCLIPECAKISYRIVIFLRVLQGIASGIGGSAVSALAAAWIPPNERSKFFTAYLGDSVSAAISFPMFGFMIQLFGWQSIFYFTTIIGTAWSLAWHFLIFDTPAMHPRISESERTYIENSLGQHRVREKLPIPWKSILTCIPFWLNAITVVTVNWSFVLLLTQVPTYFTNIHGMIVSMAGIFSGLPHVCRIVFGMIFSLVADIFIKKELLSKGAVHKIATSICSIFQGLFVLGMAYSGCNSTIAIICLTIALGCCGTLTTGPIASSVDNSPNFASITMGVIGFVSFLPSFISPLIVGLMTYQNQTSDSWEIVFLIGAVPLIISGFIYIIFGSSDLQSWNSPIVSKEMETMCLNVKSKEIRT